MKEQLFIQKNTPTWKSLEQYYKKVNAKGFKSLPSNEIKEYLHLFRVASHHLAYAKTHYDKSNTVLYLNSLISKCHSHIYGVKKSSLNELKSFVCSGFPKLLRELKYYILFSFGIFLLGTLVSFIMTYTNPNNASFFVPQNYIDSAKSQSMGNGNISGLSPVLSSQIMTNNISVAFRAFVYGIIPFGIGTIYILFYNGLMLGSLTGLVYLYNRPLQYWSLILPHGIIELTATFIAGAAGLIIAKNLLIPGEYTRWQAVIKGAKKSITLILGVIFMLIIAGTIEGFFTPSNAKPVTKLIFAGVTAVLLFLYFSIPYIKHHKYV